MSSKVIQLQEGDFQTQWTLSALIEKWQHLHQYNVAGRFRRGEMFKTGLPHMLIDLIN